MKLYLKIDGTNYQLMKMDAGSDIELNIAHDNLENPSNYVSEYAYDLKVPICPENNKLFSNFVHLDSVLVAGGYDPANYLPYVLTDNTGSPISTGRAYVKSISDGYYNLALTGVLAHIFQKLLNSGYDTTITDDDYYHMTDWLKKAKAAATFMDAGNYISRIHVLASWLISTPTFDLSTLLSTTSLLTAYGVTDTNVTETAAFIASLIGFAPTAQGLLPEFSNEKWMESGRIGDSLSTVPAILPVLCSQRSEDNEPVNPPDVGDGLVEAQMGEYRSYYQQPYIYVNKLWQLYQREFPAITGGYSLVLDPRWFNGLNPKVAGMVYMLPRLFDGGQVDASATTEVADATANASFSQENYQRSSDIITINGLMGDHTAESATVIANTVGNMLSYAYALNVQQISGKIMTTSEQVYDIYGSNKNFPIVTVRLLNTDNTVMATKKYVIVPIPDDGKYDIQDAIDLVTLQQAVGLGYTIVEAPFTPGETFSMETTIEDTIAAINTRSSDGVATPTTNVRLEVNVGYYSNVTPFAGYDDNNSKYYCYGNSYSSATWAHTLEAGLTNVVATTSAATRTEKKLSLEALFRDEKPFSVLLKHSKLMHLVWVVDEASKQVTVMTSEAYFADNMASHGVLDITPYIDKSKGLDVVPLSWNERKVAFNYDKADLDYIGTYPEKYGVTYGSKLLTTQNKLHAETKNLLCNGENDTIAPCALLSETVYPVVQILAGGASQTYAENLPMPLNQKDGKSADAHGAFYYRRANSAPSALISSGWRHDEDGDFVYITDDSDAETNQGEYCWHGPLLYTSTYAGSFVKCHSVPMFDTTSVDGSISLHFAAVRERFSEYHREPVSYLYEAVWQDYVEEVYNVQNKTLIAYAYLPRTVFEKVRINPLVQYGNVAYMLTAVEGWGENDTLCRLTLRQISDITKLTGQ